MLRCYIPFNKKQKLFNDHILIRALLGPLKYIAKYLRGFVHVSDGKVLSQPACQEEWRSVKKRKNSNIDVMYICVPMCVSCSATMLFTCTLVRSRPDSNEGVTCETQSIGTSSKMLGGPGQTRNILGKEDQQEAQSKPRSRLKDIFARGSKKIAVQVYTDNNCVFLSV
jgi:hypothetical protein